MEIKRTTDIFQDQFKLSKPDTAGEFTKHLVKKWVADDDLIDKIKLLRQNLCSCQDSGVEGEICFGCTEIDKAFDFDKSKPKEGK